MCTSNPHHWVWPHSIVWETTGPAGNEIIPYEQKDTVAHCRKGPK